MKLALFGVGNAGTRLVDQLLAVETRADRPLTNGQVLAFNTTPSAFAETSQLDDERQVVIGDIHPDVVQPEDIETPDAETDDENGETNGENGETGRREGVAGDPELGVEVARDDLPEIRRALDMVDDTEVDAAMIVAGLGGGTGCGLGAVLLEELAAIYEIPVYVLGVLPTSEESDRRAWTAARAVRTFVPLADSVIPIDNESWIDEHGTDKGYSTLNEAIANRLVSLFGAGERESTAISELRMDPNDVKRTLEIGGLATVGYAETELAAVSEGWYRRLRRLLGFNVPDPEPQTDAVSIKDLVQRAVDSELTLPCDIETADRVLLVLSGPPKELSRKGFETGRYLLEDETGTVEVLAGDEPLPEASRITATILLSNVTGVPRIEALQRRAVDFQREQNELSTGNDQSDAVDLSVGSDEQSTADGESTADGKLVDDDHGFDFRDEGVVGQSEAEDEQESTPASSDAQAESESSETEEESPSSDAEEKPTPSEDDATEDDAADEPDAESEPQQQ